MDNGVLCVGEGDSPHSCSGLSEVERWLEKGAQGNPAHTTSGRPESAMVFWHAVDECHTHSDRPERNAEMVRKWCSAHVLDLQNVIAAPFGSML